MNAKKIIGLMMIITLLSTSCSDFFDNDPKTALTEEEAYLNHTEALIGSLYNQWRDIRKDRGGLMFQLGSDESQQGAFQVSTDRDQAALDRYDGSLSPSNNALTQQWDSRWRLVSAAAKAVKNLEINTPEELKPLLGEACFIRAVLNFELTQYWGEIPLIDAKITPVHGLTRQPLALVYDLIIKDLERAEQYLPEKQTDKRKVSKGAAQALLGKVYLSALIESGIRDYAKAAEYFKKVIDNGNYRLVANYADLFDPNKPNTTESIYEYQFSIVYPDNNQIQWQTGSRALADVANGYCYFGGYDLILPTIYCYNNASEGGIWEDGDLRKSESIRYDFQYDDYKPTLPGGFGGDELDPHIKKYEDKRTDRVTSFWYSGKNVHYLRLADIYLCYAECLNETGKTSDAVNIVNANIRSRAWGGSLPDNKKWSTGMSQEDFRKNIMDERMRELCFEGWRRMDLIRTGKFVELVKTHNKWTKASGTIQQFHSRYPIPLTEIKQNEDISEEDQNPGYGNY
ncbi:putative outer membrane starch-binding protein [Dysgonomonas alginatilytica]|uniref:Putative outer membrane starch-binding protein n=1 Tax=Dysgonomonas alginatilytica TaxID=1605892 RepID=A0A2V3PWT4_9BACT|nr:RagB/SusD family nutrient uptake outer membrane protein [Dysgonomonas alginatilytica]PXV65024.1 putative outer membrane starch-binding protein [Dysgonomonas alginatilytica]